MRISPIQKEINRNLLKTNTENKRAFNKENTVNKYDFGEFKLEKKQIEKLKDWQKKIKEIFGQYGKYDYIFTPYGMITGVKVHSHLTKTDLDLSEE